MSWTATDLLAALEQTGTPARTIEMGQKFVRLMQTEDPNEMLEHLADQGITEGTIQKGRSLLSGKTKVEDHIGPPPPLSNRAEHQRLAKIIAEEMGRVLAEQQTRQFEKQAEAQAAGIGNPTKKKKELVGADS